MFQGPRLIRNTGTVSFFKYQVRFFRMQHQAKIQCSAILELKDVLLRNQTTILILILSGLKKKKFYAGLENNWILILLNNLDPKMIWIWILLNNLDPDPIK